MQTNSTRRWPPLVSRLLRSSRLQPPQLRQAHALVIKVGLDLLPFPVGKLIAAAAAVADAPYARSIFDRVPAPCLFHYTALLRSLSLARTPAVADAFSIFSSLRSSSGVAWDQFAFVPTLKVCARGLALRAGQQLHCLVLKLGFLLYVNVRNTLIHLYCRCGRAADDGRRMFDEMPQENDAVSWSALMTMYAKTKCMDSAAMVFDATKGKDLVLYNCMVDGYVKSGAIKDAFALLARMKDEGVKPNSATFVGLLSACASSGAVVVGRHIQEHIKEEGLELDAVLGTALVDMYSKSGCLDEAIKVFDGMVGRDVQAWTAMITGLGVHGRAEAALQLFRRMEDEGTRPNEVTFLSVLNACSHGGLVAAAKECFERMVYRYGLSPKMEHYGCLIDLFGRAGILEEAHELIRSMPFEGDAVAWRALLAACRVHGNVELGEVAQRTLVSLGDEHPSDVILLSSTYAAADRWADIEQLGSVGADNAMEKKKAGRSLIEMDVPGLLPTTIMGD
ncbi:PPR repeat [Musa troglodytarum]|uniref:PPR repeat n=1 Tax=Musa troglodytarum TaxID=320322 RepID=A0A9E7HQR7_9LILI|nr:PPR repeat [Musa troglodytarum]